MGSTGRAVRRFSQPADAAPRLEFFAIVILALAFAQTFPIDLAILFAGDTLMYLEILTIVRLAAGWEHIQQALRLAARLARFAMQAVRMAIGQSVSRINRVRERRTPTRPARPRIADRSDDDRAFGSAWDALATA